MNATLPPLSIRSGQGDYAVDFVASIPALAEEIGRLPNCVLAVDRNVAHLFADELGSLFASRPTHLIDATEEAKTPDGALGLLGFLQSANATKQTAVVAIGGGIIQDIATFAAHVYYRGLRLFLVPTTLLGMSDSCIGAKSAINFGAFKNQLGVFHSPAHVWVCLDFLATLSNTEIRSGYGEILKLHLTDGHLASFDDLRSIVDRDGWRNDSLARFIRESLEVKKSVIEQDEYERDLRRVLNYGHTFGHALEAVTRHGIPHGLAVAWGVDLANFLAWRTGLLAEDDFQTVHGFVARHFSWPLPQAVSAAELITAARRDKKVADSRINLILPERLGTLRILRRAFDDELQSLIAEYLANWSVVQHDAPMVGLS